MTPYIALLRAVNVGGSGKLPMAELRRSLESAGYGEVRTLLASGNVVLEAEEPSPAKLETNLEEHLAAAHGLDTDVLVRTADEWAALVADNPMPEPAASSPSKFVLWLTKEAPDEDALARYLETYEGPETVAAGDRCLYIHYPAGQGRSKLKFPKAVGVGTARNWNTVGKLAKLLEG